MKKSKSKKLKILFIGDSWEILDHARDSTLYLAQYAEKKLTANCYWATESDFYVLNGELLCNPKKLIQLSKNPALAEKKEMQMRVSEFTSVHWRVDPPVGLSSMRLWSMLDSIPAFKMINSPSALLRFNEKFSTLRFQEWSIPSFYSNSLDELLSHLKKNAKIKLLVKSVAEAASRGVQLLSNSPEARIDEVVAFYEKHGPWIVLQNFSPAIQTKGETRAFVIDGKIAGCLKKIPSPDAPIMSLDAPRDSRPSLKIATLSTIQKKRAQTIAKALQKNGVILATIDFIEDQLLEINVTSAGLLRWYDQEFGEPVLAKKYFTATTRKG